MTTRDDGSIPVPESTTQTDPGSGQIQGIDWERIATLLAQQNSSSQGAQRPELPDMITGESRGALAVPTLPQEGPTHLWREGMGPTGTERDAAMGDQSFFKRNPRYSVDYPINALNDLSSAQLAALEVQMQQAGYFDDDDKTVGLGKRSSALIRNFSSLVNEADQNRVTWDQQLVENIRLHEEGLDQGDDEGYGPFIAPMYLKPDYDTLAQRVKGSVRQGLGRDATSGEMELLTQYLGTKHKEQWQAREYNPALQDHNQRSRAHETGEDQGSVTGQDVDMQASFNEMFEGRYENELEHRERVDQTRNQSASLFGSLDTISRSI